MIDPDQSFCYVTTTGRVTGKPHEIEIWYAARDSTIYLLSGGRDGADWVKNLIATPEVQVRVGGESLDGTARVVADEEEDGWARQALLEKYSPSYSGDLTSWSRSSLAVAIDVQTN